MTLTSRICTSASVLALALTTAGAVAQSTVVYSTPTDVVVKRADGQFVNNTITASTMLNVAGKDMPAAAVKPGTKLTKDLPDGKIVTGTLRSTFVIGEDGKVDLALYNVKATGHVASLRKKLGLDK